MNLFSISSVAISIASLGFGFFIYVGNRTSRLGKLWFIFSIFIACWGLGLYGVTAAQTYQGALLWQYLLDTSAIFIPFFYFSFVQASLGIDYRWLRRLILAIALFIFVLSFTSLYKNGVNDHAFGFYWIDPGPLYFLFPLYFATVTLVSIYLLVHKYFETRNDPFKRGQIRNHIIAAFVGFSGGVTNFFPQLFNVYPFGNYFVILYVFFMSYAVLRYRFLNVKILSAQLFAGALVLASLFNLLESDTLNAWLVRLFIFTVTAVLSIFLVRSVYREVEAREQIQKLATDLEKANERLKELDQLKSEFVSIASHQLRSPLAAIKGYASLVLEGSFGKPPAAIADAVQKIFDSSKALALVVEDFLNISRIEQGRMKYDFAETDLGKLVKSVVDELLPTVARAKLEIAFESDGQEPYMAKVDIGKMQQVITNLVDNAIKYTPKGSIHVRIGKFPGNKIRISISDTGIGMSSETISALFEKFSRAKDANKTNVMGTGLGLYVAKEMVEAHGGKIWAESEGKDKGSTFIVELAST